MEVKFDGAVLAGTDVFRGLDREALAQVAAAARIQRLAAGATAFRQDDPAEAFCVLLAGELKITQLSADGQQVVVRYIGPGEMFGAVAVFCRTGYPANAVVVTESIVARWDSGAIDGLIGRYPRIGANALQVVGLRLQELQNRYRELATERVERRVAHLLLRLAQRAGRQGVSGVRIGFPISRQDIAEMSGTTLHTVSRILSAWESQGFVETGRQRVTVRAPERLSSIAGGL